MTDKVPLETVAEKLLLFEKILCAVLSNEIHSRLGECGEVLRVVILGGDEDADLLLAASTPLQSPLYFLVLAGESIPDLRSSSLPHHRR
jgi:hypothetical protein